MDASYLWQPCQTTTVWTYHNCFTHDFSPQNQILSFLTSFTANKNGAVELTGILGKVFDGINNVILANVKRKKNNVSLIEYIRNLIQSKVIAKANAGATEDLAANIGEISSRKVPQNFPT